MADDLVIGGQLGNYLIESVIGRGGMSVVYRARHSRLGTSVALKVLAPELSTDDTFRERFLREAQMAAGIDHPNVIPIHDMGLQDNSLYIVMRFIPGGDLKELLATSGPLEAERAIELLMPIALALDAAHAHGLVHRDVKPGNILVQRSASGAIDHVYLTDFGIAKSVAAIGGLTRAGGLIGTVEYMAPEQAQGRDVSAATDVFALASVFYQCITAKTPFERELLAGAWPPVGTPESVSSVRPELPAALDGVIAKGLSADPADRYATCEQFLNACAYVLDARAGAVGGTAGATVADSGPAAETVAAGAAGAGGPAAGAPTPPDGAGDAWPPVTQPPPPPAAPPPPVSPPPRGRPGIGATLKGRWGYAALLAAVAVVAIVVVLASSPSTKTTKPASAALGQVPTNHVTGSGSATVSLKGDVATVTVTTNGLDENEALAHALHIHAGGKGQCPPASAARLHNGHRTISTTDGINYYGNPVTALTTKGDTSTSSIVVLPRYPSGGMIRYTRTITLPASVAAYIRQNNAVIVVHGIDYDHSGAYSGVLERSELNKSLPATATAPALCGALVGAQKTASSGAHALVYAASLHVDPLAQFMCEAAAGIPLAADRPGVSAATRRGVGGAA
jgi:tRNA A-37 threonylcarbamoyl transferase component Bud32